MSFAKQLDGQSQVRVRPGWTRCMIRVFALLALFTVIALGVGNVFSVGGESSDGLVIVIQNDLDCAIQDVRVYTEDTRLSDGVLVAGVMAPGSCVEMVLEISLESNLEVSWIFSNIGTGDATRHWRIKDVYMTTGTTGRIQIFVGAPGRDQVSLDSW